MIVQVRFIRSLFALMGASTHGDESYVVITTVDGTTTIARTTGVATTQLTMV